MAKIALQNVSVTYDIGLRNLLLKPLSQFATEVGGKLTQGAFGGQVAALHNVDLTIGQGMRVGLVGVNGAGKTTLLKLMSGIMAPSSGKLDIEGRVTSLISTRVGLEPRGTGRENAVLRAMLNGVSRADAEARLPEIMEYSGLGDYMDVPIRAYSNGMVARLVFAVSTAFAPEIVLIDEAIVAGDDNFRRKTAARVREFVADSGILVIAAHAPALLNQMCTHLAWMNGGRLVRFGPIAEIEALYLECDGLVDEEGEPLIRAAASAAPLLVENAFHYGLAELESGMRSSSFVKVRTEEGGDGVMIEGGGPNLSSGGATEGANVRVPDGFEWAASGRKIRVDVVAKSQDPSGGRLAIAYATNDVGNSSWRWFDVPATSTTLSFTYSVPALINGNGDFVGFTCDRSRSGLPIIIEAVSASVLAETPDVMASGLVNPILQPKPAPKAPDVILNEFAKIGSDLMQAVEPSEAVSVMPSPHGNGILVRGGSPNLSSGGRTGGASLQVPDGFEWAASGKTIMVEVVARPSDDRPARLAVAYATNDVGNSSWCWFDVPAGPATVIQLSYAVPKMIEGNGDFVGFMTDLSVSNAPVFIEMLTARVFLVGEEQELEEVFADDSVGNIVDH